jgi:hypothetical protein
LAGYPGARRLIIGQSANILQFLGCRHALAPRFLREPARTLSAGAKLSYADLSLFQIVAGLMHFQKPWPPLRATSIGIFSLCMREYSTVPG